MPTLSNLIPPSGVVTGQATSVDDEIALFSGTSGKTLKRSTTTGILKASSGVLSAAVSGTDIKTVNGTSLLGSGNLIIQSSFDVYSYDNRGDTRALSPADGDQIIIEGLGVFVFKAGSIEQDDGETCFATASGRWLLEAAHWDVVMSHLPELPDVFVGSIVNTVATVTTLSQASILVDVPGAQPGNVCIVSPSATIDSRIAISAFCSSVDKVTIIVSNPSAGAASLSTTMTWNVVAIG